MINFLEYINVIAEADAPGLGPAGGGTPATPPAGGAPAGGAPAGGTPAAPPTGGDLGGLSSGGGGGLSSVPSASGGGGAGGVLSLDAGMGGGAAPAGDMGALKAPNINLKDAFYYLEDFFNKNKK